MLCPDCDSLRHKEWLASRGEKSMSCNTVSSKKTKITVTTPNQCRSADAFKQFAKEVNIVCTTQSESLDNASRFVCNELLAYVYCYRESSNADALRRVVLNYFSYEDITAAKKLLCHEFQFTLANTPSSVLLTERRSSISRPPMKRRSTTLWAFSILLTCTALLITTCLLPRISQRY